MNLERARELARASLANLEAHRQRIDDLNVYPVPDGDTGTNLTLTVRSIVEALEASTAEGHEAVAKELSRAALMGARGNSGVIFSQILRGFADVLAERDEVDSAMLARAFRSASDSAYRAVRRPVEGTMLTVVREMAEEAERRDVRTPPQGRAARACGRARRGRARADARAARGPARGRGRRRRAAPACSSSSEASTPASRARPLPATAAAVSGRGGRLRRGPPGAVALPLLHGIRGRGRGARRGGARARARAARRLPAGGRRLVGAQGARPHRRSRAPRSRSRTTSRHDRRGRDREHAPPDDGA